MSGFVYFMQCEATTRIKIGWSADPQRRLQDLNGTAPTKILLLCCYPAARPEEGQLHRRFASTRVTGLVSREWFYLTPDLRSLIEAHGGKPTGDAVLTEQLLRVAAKRILEQVAVVEALVGDVLEIADPYHQRRDYRHERFGGVELSGGLVRDIERARAWLRSWLQAARDDKREAMRELVATRVNAAHETARHAVLDAIVNSPAGSGA